MLARRPGWILIVCAAALAALLAQDVLAQGGGGGSYSGGRGGGGGGGDGDGLGFLIYFLIRLIIDAPVIGIPLAIVVLIVFVAMAKKGRGMQKAHTIRRGVGVRSRAREVSLVERLRRSDPSFDEEAFLARVRSAFRKLQDAWCAQDLQPIRPFVSDGIHERFSLQIAEQRQDGWRQGMANTRIQSASLLHVDHDQHFDTVTVQIAFTSDIHRVSRETGEKIRGSELPWTDFIEAWTFLRRSGAKTKDGKGLFEGHCPNCAAPLQLNQSAQCSACGSEVLSGQHDWVLVEITQAVEWRAEDTSDAPGLAPLKARDRAFSIQALEDRASVMFWRKVAADRAGKTDPLAKVATTELQSSYAGQLGAGPDGLRTWLGDVAVGSVKTLGFTADGARDRAAIEVRWDGRRFRTKGGQPPKAEGDRALQRTLLVVERAKDARSDLGHALISNHCPSCGAPDDGSLTPTCSYCGFALTDGSKDWVLTGIHSFLDTEARTLLQELRDQPARGAVPPLPAAAHPSRADALRWALATAMEDGHVDEEESQVLRGMARKLGISEHEALQMPARVRNAGADAPKPDSPAEAREWLTLMVSAMLDDGRISKGEQRMLDAAAKRFGYVHADVTRLVREVQTKLYRETREAKRARR